MWNIFFKKYKFFQETLFSPCWKQHRRGLVIHIIVTFIFCNWCLIFPVYWNTVILTETSNVNADQLPHQVFDTTFGQGSLTYCHVVLCVCSRQYQFRLSVWKTTKQSFLMHINLSTSLLNLCLLLTWQLDYTYYSICHQHIHYLAINGPSTVIFDFIYSCNCELGLYTFQLTICQHSPNSSEAVKTG